MAMIEVSNLTRYYGDLCAVDRISLEINRGEIVGLLGPNGAGKTTTLRMLTGFLVPSSGTITVKGMSIHDRMVDIKRIMGYLPESAPIYPDMLVYDYLCYVADIRGVDREKRMPVLSRVARMCGLESVMHQPVGDLSKGFRQRVGLAHAMIHDPDILVLDEPTSGLDPNQIVEIREIIRRIGRQKTIIFSTHILSEAEATCDRVVIIDKGKIVADGPTHALMGGDGVDAAISLVLSGATGGDVETVLKSVDGVRAVEVDSRPSSGGSDLLHVRLTCDSSSDPRAAIYNRIKQTDWVLLEFSSQTRSLEHIFRKLTREE